MSAPTKRFLFLVTLKGGQEVEIEGPEWEADADGYLYVIDTACFARGKWVSIVRLGEAEKVKAAREEKKVDERAAWVLWKRAEILANVAEVARCLDTREAVIAYLEDAAKKAADAEEAGRNKGKP